MGKGRGGEGEGAHFREHKLLKKIVTNVFVLIE